MVWKTNFDRYLNDYVLAAVQRHQDLQPTQPTTTAAPMQTRAASPRRTKSPLGKQPNPQTSPTRARTWDPKPARADLLTKAVQRDKVVGYVNSTCGGGGGGDGREGKGGGVSSKQGMS